MSVRTQRLAYRALAVFTVLFVGFALVVPIYQSIKAYQKYQDLTKQNNYVNATVRSISTAQPFMQKLLRGCYLAVEYEYLVDGKLVQSGDELACKYDDQLVIGNTLPVYYDGSYPDQSVTNFAQIQSPKDLFANSLFGFMGTIALVVAIILRYHQLHKQYTEGLNY